MLDHPLPVIAAWLAVFYWPDTRIAFVF